MHKMIKLVEKTQLNTPKKTHKKLEVIKKNEIINPLWKACYTCISEVREDKGMLDHLVQPAPPVIQNLQPIKTNILFIIIMRRDKVKTFFVHTLKGTLQSRLVFVKMRLIKRKSTYITIKRVSSG